MAVLVCGTVGPFVFEIPEGAFSHLRRCTLEDEHCTFYAFHMEQSASAKQARILNIGEPQALHPIGAFVRARLSFVRSIVGRLESVLGTQSPTYIIYFLQRLYTRTTEYQP